MARIYGRILKSFTSRYAGVPILAFYGPVDLNTNLDCLRLTVPFERVWTNHLGYYEMMLEPGVYTIFALVDDQLKPHGSLNGRYEYLVLQNGDFVQQTFE